MKKTAEEVISTIREAGANTIQEVIDTLGDGAVLSELGITNADQTVVEEAHNMLRGRNGRRIVCS